MYDIVTTKDLEANAFYDEQAEAVRLTHEEEQELIQKFRDGDKAAGDTLALSVYGYVHKLVKQKSYGRGWYEQEDERESAVNLAISRALASFDPSKGKLTTHVHWQTLAVCAHYSSFTQTIRTPVYNGKEFYPAEAKKARRRCTSLDAQFSSHEERTLGETLPDRDHRDPGDDFETHVQRLKLRWALDQMGDLDADVIRMRAIQGLTLEEAGKVIGVTRERVRQREARGLQRLRNFLLKAPDDFRELVDKEGKPFALDGILGDASCDEEIESPHATEEIDVMAGRTLTELLRQLTVADVDRELTQLEENRGSQISTYQDDRRRLQRLRELLGNRKAPDSEIRQPPSRRPKADRNLPQVFPREGTQTDTLYKLLLSEGMLPLDEIARRMKVSQGHIRSVLLRYRDRYFVQHKTGWQAIPESRVEIVWHQTHGALAASA